MYKYLLFVVAMVLVFSFNPANAQNNPDSRLLSKFSKKELRSMDAPSIDYWTFYLENSFEITDIPKGKGDDAITQTISLKNVDKKDINVFKLGLKPHEFARDYYRIEGTDKMIIVLPLTEIDKNFKSN